MTVFNHDGAYNLNVATLCPQNISSYITNLTASYTDQSNEPAIVSSSVIMFVLAGLFFNLNLFSGISDVSAILDPKVRLFLSSALSLFLPVMSYLFSEAKNARPYTTTSSASSSTSAATADDLSLTAGLILAWMLLVELLRKKVDEIRMRGYSGTIQRAGRVVWLGSLVFFNIRSAGRKAVFGILWILCATKVAQRIAFTEVGKRSYAHGKNASVLTSYMAQMLDERRRQQQHPAPPAAAGGGDQQHVDVEHGAQLLQGGGNDGGELLRRCSYIVMGEKKLVKKATADGYEFNDVASNDGIVTVGKVWELAESDQLFAHYDKSQRLKRLCLSFALFKLLRRRFEHLPAMTDSEACDCRSLILNGLYSSSSSNGEGGDAAEALFQVMHDEVNFLSEYYHSVIPVVFASPFFLVANYLLLPAVVAALCLMSVVLCGNGDAGYAFQSLGRDNYTLRSGVPKIVLCLVARAANGSPPAAAFFSLVDLAITVFLFVIFFYEEIWEFLVFLLSNWFMVSVLCDYAGKRHWRESATFSGAFRRLLWLRSKMSHGDLRLKQFSVLNLRWPLLVPLFGPLSLAVRSEPAPNSLKRSIMDCLVRHDRDGGTRRLTNGASALRRHHAVFARRLAWACGSDSVAEVILTWHIATSILEVRWCAQVSAGCARRRRSKDDDEVALRRVATRLSRYCAYLVAFHPELLPDNKEKAERVFEDMKAELKSTLGCPAYFLASKSTRVKRIMERAGRREILPHVETPEAGQDHQDYKASADEADRRSGGGDDSSKVVLNGAKLADDLLLLSREDVWKVLADVWTELIVFVAPSNDEERVKGHEQVLVQGGEFITVLWALTTHIGVTRPAPAGKRSSASTSGRAA